MQQKWLSIDRNNGKERTYGREWNTSCSSLGFWRLGAGAGCFFVIVEKGRFLEVVVELIAIERERIEDGRLPLHCFEISRRERMIYKVEM